MRFEFCGGIACPEWFIAEISALTKITALKTRLAFSLLVEHYLAHADIADKLSKLLTGTGLDSSEVNSVISTLHFILQNSVTFQVTEAVLNKELLDLGLPKQNVESIARIYRANRDKLIDSSAQKMFRISSDVDLRYNVQELIGSSRLGTQCRIKNCRFLECDLSYKSSSDAKETRHFVLPEDQLDELIHQLETALALMSKKQ